MIRRAVVTEATQIAECLSGLGYGTGSGVIVDRLIAWEGSPVDAVFVAFDQLRNRVLGVASVHVIPLLHQGEGLGRLTALAVHSGTQRHGIGRQLLMAAEEFSRLAGCARLEVTSGDQRLGAHAFYRALGYSERSRRFVKVLGEDSAHS